MLKYQNPTDKEYADNRIFFLKNGKLSLYSFSCGYIETYSGGDKVDYTDFSGKTTKRSRFSGKIYQEYPSFFLDFADYKTNNHNRFYFDKVLQARKKIAEINRLINKGGII